MPCPGRWICGALEPATELVEPSLAANGGIKRTYRIPWRSSGCTRRAEARGFGIDAAPGQDGGGGRRLSLKEILVARFQTLRCRILGESGERKGFL